MKDTIPNLDAVVAVIAIVSSYRSFIHPPLRPSSLPSSRQGVGELFGGWCLNVGEQVAWDEGDKSVWMMAQWQQADALGVAINIDYREVWFYWQGQRICRCFPWQDTYE